MLRVDKLLLTRPLGTHSLAKARWDQMKELTASLFELYKLDDRPIFDRDCYYDTWKDKDDKFEGMRHRQTKRAHGICRQVFDGSFITA